MINFLNALTLYVKKILQIKLVRILLLSIDSSIDSNLQLLL